MEKFETLADLIAESNRIVVFTGAGFSTESSVPDFRGPQGVWEKFDPSELNLQNFLRYEDIRVKYWQVHRLFWETVREAEPNSGHYAVTEIHNMGKLDAVITQNTDGLHQKSGTPDEKVLELHGTMHWVDCLECRKRYPREEVHQMMLAGQEVPRCNDCNGILKPATVAYGQSMPQREMQESEERSANCDLLIGAGSSMVVYPAAQMPIIAKRSGARLAIINLTDTPHDHLADIVINEKTGEVLSKAVARAKEKSQK